MVPSKKVGDSLSLTPMMVLQARKRLADLVFHTPLQRSVALEKIAGSHIYIKWESLQLTGVFKLRGALNKISSLPDDIARQGVVTASTGNHGLAVAYAAQQRGIPATVVVPKTVSPLKLEKCKQYGATIYKHGANYDEAASYSLKYAAKTGATLIHAYSDPQVIAGQGTVGYEVLEDLPETNKILVPIGGGGLVSGISLWVKAINPSIKIIGVQSTATHAFYENYKAKQLFHVPIEPTIADGLAGNTEQLNLDIALRYVDDVVLVKEEKLKEAIFWTLKNERRVLEPAGVVGIAAVLQSKVAIQPHENLVIIATGCNIDPNLLHPLSP